MFTFCTFFFFKQKTAYEMRISDWSSDVCSSDLFLPGQDTNLMNMTRYQDPDWREQLPPKLLTQGARVDPTWLLRFLRNPALSENDLHRNGVRPYLREIGRASCRARVCRYV